MMAGRAGVVRLVPDEEVGTGLGIAEGIEKALAVDAAQSAGGPVWVRRQRRRDPHLPRAARASSA